MTDESIAQYIINSVRWEPQTFTALTQLTGITEWGICPARLRRIVDGLIERKALTTYEHVAYPKTRTFLCIPKEN